MYLIINLYIVLYSSEEDIPAISSVSTSKEEKNCEELRLESIKMNNVETL